MANIGIDPVRPPVNPNEGAGAVLIVGGALASLLFAGLSIAAVFAASNFAGGALIVVVAVLGLLARQVLRSERPSVVALALIVLAGLWAVFAGYFVFKWHWLAFTPAVWVLNLLFVGALLAGAWRTLKAWAKALTAIFFLSLVTATIVLPRPSGGDGALDTTEEWKINVAVVDEADNMPLENARVLCGTVMRWKGRLKFGDTGARLTGSDGRATWEFDEDPRLRIVICTVWKDANEINAGYPAESQALAAPAGGGEYDLTFTLTENLHPDTAFLALDLSGAYQQAWYYLDFEVWRGEPLGEFAARDGPQPLTRRQWQQMPGRGFTLDADDTQSALSVRYRYEGPAGSFPAPPYSEIRTIDVGPIPGGTRRRVALSIPAEQMAN